jgi:hypothetical protein
MEIIEEHDNEMLRSKSAQEILYLIEEVGLACHRADRPALPEGIGERRRIIGWSVAREKVYPQAVRGRFGQIVAPPDKNQCTVMLCLPAKHLSERGFADPCLAANQDEAATPGNRCAKKVAQACLLPLATDEHGRRV